MPIRKWDDDTVARLQKEGRGQGEGADYKPWIYVTDFSSRGKARPVPGLKVDRMHQVLSDPEYNFLLCAEWSPNVLDIREQFPLDREVSLRIANDVGLPHPNYDKTNVPMVMTVDFLLIMQGENGQPFELAVNIKTDDAAEDRRTVNRLELQRAYFEALSTKHLLVFESRLPSSVCLNLATLRSKLIRKGEEPTEQRRLLDHKEAMVNWARSIKGSQAELSATLLCADFEALYGLPSGDGLRLLAILFRERAIPVNLYIDNLFTAPWVHLKQPRPSDEKSILFRSAA